MMDINLKLEVSDQFLWDVLCTAVEGGSNYWAQFKTLERYEGEHGPEHARVRVTEYGDADSAVSRKEIGLTDLAEGMRRIMTRTMDKPEDHANVHSSHSGALLVAVVEDDAGQVDGELADLILQAAMFGHIVYG
ncbi:hypothetical protein ACTHR6_24965 [Ralstonia holmesii]|uniref:hypothetical protein n=1 Tax=Ralstonia TaxID=48736 RepID=UPI00046828D9|nr:hypothetical protein [Ralstonia pickettii]